MTAARISSIVEVAPIGTVMSPKAKASVIRSSAAGSTACASVAMTPSGGVDPAAGVISSDWRTRRGDQGAVSPSSRSRSACSANQASSSPGAGMIRPASIDTRASTS
jgi:hypothetical protein